MGKWITVTDVRNGREFEFDYEIEREERDKIIEELLRPEVYEALKTLEDDGYDLEDLRNNMLDDLITEKRNEVEGLIHCWHNVRNW